MEWQRRSTQLHNGRVGRFFGPGVGLWVTSDRDLISTLASGAGSISFDATDGSRVVVPGYLRILPLVPALPVTSDDVYDLDAEARADEDAATTTSTFLHFPSTAASQGIAYLPDGSMAAYGGRAVAHGPVVNAAVAVFNALALNRLHGIQAAARTFENELDVAGWTLEGEMGDALRDAVNYLDEQDADLGGRDFERLLAEAAAMLGVHADDIEPDPEDPRKIRTKKKSARRLQRRRRAEAALRFTLDDLFADDDGVPPRRSIRSSQLKERARGTLERDIDDLLGDYKLAEGVFWVEEEGEEEDEDSKGKEEQVEEEEEAEGTQPDEGADEEEGAAGPLPRYLTAFMIMVDRLSDIPAKLAEGFVDQFAEGAQKVASRDASTDRDWDTAASYITATVLLFAAGHSPPSKNIHNLTNQLTTLHGDLYAHAMAEGMTPSSFVVDGSELKRRIVQATNLHEYLAEKATTLLATRGQDVPRPPTPPSPIDAPGEVEEGIDPQQLQAAMKRLKSVESPLKKEKSVVIDFTEAMAANAARARAKALEERRPGQGPYRKRRGAAKKQQEEIATRQQRHANAQLAAAEKAREEGELFGAARLLHRAQKLEEQKKREEGEQEGEESSDWDE